MSFYKGKFSRDEKTISDMMDAETWLLGKDAADLGFSCEVIPTDAMFKAAACVREMPKFNNTPNSVKALFKITENKFMNEINDKLEDEIQKDVENQEAQEQQNPAEETQPEEKAEQEKPAEDEKKCEDVEKRVQGMQSAMAKQMDVQRKQFEARINDFQNQLKAKDEELTRFKAEVTSLHQRLEDS